MDPNSALFKAILALDVYNRGYDAGLDIDGNQLGDVTVHDDSGILSAPGASRSDQAISFFAQSYTTGSGTIISFRGTDSLIWDPIYGYEI